MRDSINARYYVQNGAKISINTVSIGALNTIENKFGYLWGHGLKDEEKTEPQKQLYKLWMEARQEILQSAEHSKEIFTDNLRKFNISKKGFYSGF